MSMNGQSPIVHNKDIDKFAERFGTPSNKERLFSACSYNWSHGGSNGQEIGFRRPDDWLSSYT